jgi:hypothetical protein
MQMQKKWDQRTGLKLVQGAVDKVNKAYPGSKTPGLRCPAIHDFDEALKQHWGKDLAMVEKLCGRWVAAWGVK